MNQILHIVQKDIRRLWPFVVIVLALQAVLAGSTIRSVETGISSHASDSLPALCTVFLALGWAAVLALLILQDPPVGEQAFWQTRPYGRLTLFSAKLLFAIFVLNLPLLISDAIVLLSVGLPFHFSELLMRQLPLLAVLEVPIMAVAAASGNIPRFALLLVGVFFGGALLANLWQRVFPLENLARPGKSDLPMVLALPLLMLPVVAWQFLRSGALARISSVALLTVLLAGMISFTHFVNDGLFYGAKHAPAEDSTRWSGLRFDTETWTQNRQTSIPMATVPLKILNEPPDVIIRGYGYGQTESGAQPIHAKLGETGPNGEGAVSLWPLDNKTAPNNHDSLRVSLESWALNNQPTRHVWLEQSRRFQIPELGVCNYAAARSSPDSYCKLICWSGPVDPPETEVREYLGSSSGSRGQGAEAGDRDAVGISAMPMGFVPIQQVLRLGSAFVGKVDLQITPRFPVGRFRTELEIPGDGK